MRWKHPYKGQTRTREGFLVLPKRIKGETRWWERAKWKQYYTEVNRMGGMGWQDHSWETE